VPWQIGHVQEFGLKYYSFFNDKFSILANVNTDSGNPFIRIIDGGMEEGGSFNAQSLQYHISQGYNASVGSVFLRMSDAMFCTARLLRLIRARLAIMALNLTGTTLVGLVYMTGLWVIDCKPVKI